MREKRITVKIAAVVTAGDAAENSENEKEMLHMTADGTMSYADGKYELRYPELFDGEGSVLCVLSFDAATPETITLVREGDISSVMTFAEGKRLAGSYTAELADLEFLIATRRLHNMVDFDGGGRILLDFSTEMNGIIVQKSKFRFDIRDCDSNFIES